MIITLPMLYVKPEKRVNALWPVRAEDGSQGSYGRQRRNRGEQNSADFSFINNVEILQSDLLSQLIRLRMRGDEWYPQLRKVVIITILNSEILLNTPNRFFNGKMD